MPNSAVYSTVTQLHTYRHSFFIFFSIVVYHRILNTFTCAIHQDLVAYSSIYNNLHLLILNSQSFPPLAPSSLATTSLFSMTVIYPSPIFKKNFHMLHLSIIFHQYILIQNSPLPLYYEIQRGGIHAIVSKNVSFWIYQQSHVHRNSFKLVVF